MKKLTQAQYDTLKFYSDKTSYCNHSNIGPDVTAQHRCPISRDELIQTGHLEKYECSVPGATYHIRITSQGRQAIIVYEFCRSMESAA